MFRRTELSLLPTYRCNAGCQTCEIWKYPTKPKEEFTAEDLSRLPSGFNRVSISGGEPTLRKDLSDLVDIAATKSSQFEIISNGSLPHRLAAIARNHPRMRVRISLDGLSAKNDEIRGIEGGFDQALRNMLELKELGMRDIGFAFTLSHRNVEQLVDVYHLCVHLGVELAQTVVHDVWQFRISNNVIENEEQIIEETKRFIRELLQSKRRDPQLRAKDWFRAYLNLGFISFVRGQSRLLPCAAGTDVAFVTPDGTVVPCNGLQTPMGNIREQRFEELWTSSQAQEARRMVSACTRNCWMTGTSRPAIKRHLGRVAQWIAVSKLRLQLGKDIDWCDPI